MDKINLTNIKPGKKCRIISINFKGKFRKRMLEMGIIKGESIEVIKYAPLGDPINIKVKGYHLSLRKAEAEGIEVEGL